MLRCWGSNLRVSRGFSGYIIIALFMNLMEASEFSALQFSSVETRRTIMGVLLFSICKLHEALGCFCSLFFNVFCCFYLHSH